MAEGIENTAQLHELRSQECDRGQGYLFARPLDPNALEAFITDRERGGGPRASARSGSVE